MKNEPLYQQLINECKVKENSKVEIPEEILKNFVRIVVFEENNIDYVRIGYMSGLFDGTGNIDAKSIENLFSSVIKEKEKYLSQNDSLLNIMEHFGVNYELTLKTTTKLKI